MLDANKSGTYLMLGKEKINVEDFKKMRIQGKSLKARVQGF